MIIFADIHGCFNTFLTMHKALALRYPDEQFVIAGDLVDRGPSSRAMIAWLIRHPEIVVLQGNHDQMMINGHKSVERFENWMMNGGDKALDGYCDYGGRRSPHHECEGLADLKKHRAWLESRPFFLEDESIKMPDNRHLLVTHAPITHGHLAEQLEQDYWGEKNFVWNRNKPPRSNVKRWFNVHGHNPVKVPEITEWYANIDTGCAYVSRGLGNLTALRVPSMEVFTHRNVEPTA